MATITPKIQSAIDAAATQLVAVSTRDDTIASWTRTLTGMCSALPGTYYASKADNLNKRLAGMGVNTTDVTTLKQAWGV